ncbi:AraC family transcriptional regulator [Ramlibacter sp. 2FC]|uniref:helix-turn-helix transcriptional regulator n=1 Tax=Ramlibacter sp. 2FC TaxID=2502188 RepID=UPI00201D4943|nr:AraC family transcriptional regulator [Ramlibacter sp. 2FC]
MRSTPAHRASDRLMWITPDRVFYVGLLGAPSVRTMGAVIAYVAAEGAIRVSIDGGEWQTTQLAVVPPYVPHRVMSEARLIHMVKLEAETVDMAHLPAPMGACGAVDAPWFVERVRHLHRELSTQGCDIDLMALDFDRVFFGQAIPSQPLDRRIRAVIDRIKADPSAPSCAETCAEQVHLSFSRFLHLFKQEVGMPFRSFRTWKRARSLLHHVNRDSNLAHVALDTGYPDSTHFSHSIRQVYGLKPKDIFAGSRRLAIYAQTAPASCRTAFSAA